MARKTVRVDVPNNRPDELVQLANDILAKHRTDAQASPLNTDAMTALRNSVITATDNNTAARQHDAQAQTLRQQRDTLLGMAAGQTAVTPGTVSYQIKEVRDLLLAKNRGNEEALAAYGFHVVVGTAKIPLRAQKAA